MSDGKTKEQIAMEIEVLEDMYRKLNNEKVSISRRMNIIHERLNGLKDRIKLIK